MSKILKALITGHANFILPNGTWLGANDSPKLLGFVVLSPVATLSWEIHTNSRIATRLKKTVIGSACTACLCLSLLGLKGLICSTCINTKVTVFVLGA